MVCITWASIALRCLLSYVYPSSCSTRYPTHIRTAASTLAFVVVVSEAFGLFLLSCYLYWDHPWSELVVSISRYGTPVDIPRTWSLVTLSQSTCKMFGSLLPHYLSFCGVLVWLKQKYLAFEWRHRVLFLRIRRRSSQLYLGKVRRVWRRMR